MRQPHHEDRDIAQLMSADLGTQASVIESWGMPPAGLLILMSPCEGRCFFCAQPAVTHPPPADWTPWARVVGLLSDNRTHRLERLCIGGTEPASHPDFERSLALAREVGFSEIELMTSALQLARPGVAERWAEAGVRTIATPIYGADAQTHDGVVDLPAFERLCAGLDAAQSAGIAVRLHSLALRQTLSGLPALSALSLGRWRTRLTLAPPRPKDGVWDFDAGAPSLEEVAAALDEVAEDGIALTGWPDCLCPDRQREAAQVISLYFLGQSRGLGQICEACSRQSACPGLVQALLARDGARGLSPQ